MPWWDELKDFTVSRHGIEMGCLNRRVVVYVDTVQMVKEGCLNVHPS